MSTRIRPGEGSRSRAQPGADGPGGGDGVGPGRGCLAWQGSWPGRMETVSYGLAGAGTDGPGGWKGALAMGTGRQGH